MAKEEKTEKVIVKKTDAALMDIIVILWLTLEKNEWVQRKPYEIN